MATKIAIDKRTALKMFWDAGFTTETKLLEANAKLMAAPQPSQGYWYADVVEALIAQAK